jgi:hypothetical protein
LNGWNLLNDLNSREFSLAKIARLSAFDCRRMPPQLGGAAELGGGVVAAVHGELRTKNLLCKLCLAAQRRKRQGTGGKPVPCVNCGWLLTGAESVLPDHPVLLRREIDTLVVDVLVFGGHA